MRKWLIGIAVTLVLIGAFAAFTVHVLTARVRRNFHTPQFTEQASLNGPLSDYDFRYSTLDGQVLHVSQLKGKVVFVNFWGTWCIGCVVEMPTVQKLYDQFKNDPSVVFVIASRLDTPARVRWYARHEHYDLPFYTIKDLDIPQAMRFNQYPATFIYAKDGTVAEHHIGGANWNDPRVVDFLHSLENR